MVITDLDTAIEFKPLNLFDFAVYACVRWLAMDVAGPLVNAQAGPDEHGPHAYGPEDCSDGGLFGS
jgi:hypothetical protein